MRDLIESYSIAIFLVALFFGGLFAIVSYQRYVNDSMEETCIVRGGEFYRSLDPMKSLCKLPKG